MINKFIVTLSISGVIFFCSGFYITSEFFILAFISILSLFILLYFDLKNNILKKINSYEKKLNKNVETQNKTEPTIDKTPASEHPIIVSARKRLKK
tara:strand:+ start:252 stop:539 length:288 start_codon:yes stop_codon:yes gene_type:complete